MASHSTPRAHLPATWLAGRLVRLRPVEPEDVPLLARWLNEPVVLDWLGPLFPRSRPETVKWAARASTDTKAPTFVIQTLRGTDIGLITLRLSEARAELGVGIHESRYWSRGYGQDAVEVIVDAAFRVLPLQRIGLFVLPQNARALRCYEKSGFVREGVYRNYIYVRGKMQDAIAMSVLPDEWAARRAKQM